IFHHSNRSLPIAYKIAVLWSGQEGSILFWCLLLSGYGFVLRLRHKVDQRLVAMASVVVAGIQIFFLSLVNFAASPFGLMDRAAADGTGLNPLLQYPEMVIHPPMLYLGYVGFSIPFAFALAALIMRYPGEKWIQITRRWTMVTWLFLTCGVVLGSHWAYAVLGWGGYWGWDPVENASVFPWLTGTAFLHSVMMQEKRGMMKVWNMWLIFITFMLTVLGTLLTRSGMISSVHAFAQSTIASWFVGSMGWLGTPWHSLPYCYPGFLEIVFVVCLVFFIKHRDHLKSENKLESLISRESSFLFNNVLLLAACFAIVCGTFFPVLSEWVRGYKITVGAPFFNKVFIPIGLIIIFLMAVGPLLAWRNTSFGSLRRNFAIPAGLTVITAIVLVLIGVRPLHDLAQCFAWVALSFAMLVTATIASEFFRGGRVLQNKNGGSILTAMYQLSRRNMRRYGGYVVHFGLVVMVVGWSGAAFNQDKEMEMGLHDKLQIGRYTLVNQAYTEDDTPNYFSETALLDVYQGDKYIGQLTPALKSYKPMNQPDHIVANRSTLAEDLYVIYEGRNQDNGHPVIKAFVNPLVAWYWIGIWVLIFGTGMALVPNAVPVKSPVSAPEAVRAAEMQPVGAGK
ncbi:MAG TPA: cytochrome c-type biogenesis CcmF C-terminal domain-containing protein, partial [Candidatus Angelobacter sp.]|nr:cytochrome c-type biogenesis CcmF C-terminal domain-containing protein [Candidatus Angelobacter sp.]